jgi:hypothetical protein
VLAWYTRCCIHLVLPLRIRIDVAAGGPRPPPPIDTTAMRALISDLFGVVELGDAPPPTEGQDPWSLGGREGRGRSAADVLALVEVLNALAAFDRA